MQWGPHSNPFFLSFYEKPVNRDPSTDMDSSLARIGMRARVRGSKERHLKSIAFPSHFVFEYHNHNKTWL